MCELSVFPIFLENDLSKVDINPRADFFKARKDLEGFNTAFFNLLWQEFCARWIVYNSRVFA